MYEAPRSHNFPQLMLSGDLILEKYFCSGKTIQSTARTTFILWEKRAADVSYTDH